MNAMTYLNPLLWAGLFLAAAPILIHLLARRRLKRQPFSTLDFLKKLQTKRMRNLRLRQWLLLLLRTLAVLLVAFAFLRPTLREQGSLGAGSSESVILLDLSGSMVARGEVGTPLDRAKEMIADLWKSNGNHSLVVMDEEAGRDIAVQQGGSETPAWIERLSVDGRTESVCPGWERAINRLNESAAGARELIVISDFSGSAPDSLPELPAGVQAYSIPVGTRAPVANAWISNVQQMDAILRSGDTATLTVQGMVTGTDQPVECIVTVSLDGRRVAEGEISLKPGSTNEITFPYQVPDVGYHAGEVTLELSDALAADNRYPFVLHVPGRRSVLLSGDDFEALRYFELALNPEGKREAFDVTVRPGAIRGSDLNGVDAVILAGWQSPDVATARQLVQFVEQGGGLWLLLGEQTDLAGLSRNLLHDLGFAPVLDEGGRSSSRTAWEDLDLNHPALRNLFDGEGRYDRPEVSRLYTVRPEAGDRALIRVGDGRPFLLERSIGKGHVWWSPVAANRDWTDWPISGVFAPMVQQGVSWLAGDVSAGASAVSCGEEIVWQTSVSGDGRGAEVRDPLGNIIPALPDFRQGQRARVTGTTWWPGHYHLLVDGVEREIAAVRFPEPESALEWGATPAWAGKEIQPQVNESMADALERQRNGSEISGPILLAVLLLLIAETMVAREGKPKSSHSTSQHAA